MTYTPRTMWARFIRWYFRRPTYPDLILTVLLALMATSFAVYWLQQGAGTGWMFVAAAVLCFAKAGGMLVYRRRHPLPPKPRWQDNLYR